MIRLSRLLLLLLLVFCAGPVAAAGAPVLKPSVLVSGSTVRLGDIFDGIGAHAAIAIAEAPPPGSTMILHSSWLLALARAEHLDWRPGSGLDQISVERASRVIGSDEIVEQLKRVLANRTPLGDAEVRLDHPDPHLTVAAEDSTALVFGNLSFDPANGRFDTSVSTPNGASAPRQLRISGQIVRYVAVPTPTRLIAPGDVIAKDDLVLVRLRADRLGPGAVTELGDLVGMTPRRPLQPGEAVRGGDIEVPLVVHRNSIVTIVLETPNMRLTAEGKAIEDGGMGAVIRVANAKSNRVIDAVVTGPNSVRVQSPL